MRVPRALRPFIGLAGTEGLARLLSFAFYILAARTLAPTGYGEVRYTITLALLAFGPLQVLVTAIQREMGAVRGLPGEEAIVGTSLAVTSGLWVATLVLSAVVASTGATGSAHAAGLAMVITGYAVFMTYYSIARGRGDIGRAAIAYAGGSLFQLLAFTIYLLIFNPTPLPTLAVFAVSSALPVLVCEIVSPVVLRRKLTLSRAVARQLWKLGLPLGIATCTFLLWQSADQIWVQRVLGNHEIGLYAAAKNLSQLFIVLPAAVSGVLIPRMAEFRQGSHREQANRLLGRSAGVSFLLSALIGSLVLLGGSSLLRVVFGSAYVPASSSLAALTVAMVLYAPFSALVSAAVGWGRPSVYTIGIGIAAVVEVAILATTHSHAATTAARSAAVSIACGLVGVLFILHKWPLVEKQQEVGV